MFYQFHLTNNYNLCYVDFFLIVLDMFNLLQHALQYLDIDNWAFVQPIQLFVLVEQILYTENR